MQALSLSALQLPCRSRGWSRARGSRRPSQLHLPAPPLPLAPLRSFAQPSHPLRSPVASLGQPLSDLAEAAAVVKPTWGLLGALVCLAGYGLFTALRVAAERAREEELQARARARHQQYLDSIGDKNQSLPSKGVETAGEEGFACTSHSGGSRFSSTGASTSVASAPGPGMGVFSGRVYERSPMVTCFAFDSSEAVTTDEASFVAPSSNGRDPLEDSPSSLPLNRSAKQPSAKVTLYYRSGWDQAVLHGSVAGGEWAGYGTSKGDSPGWHKAVLEMDDVVASSGTPLLEFVMTNKAYQDWDKPMAGGNYTIQEPGTYTLRNGDLAKLWEGPPFMVVSDLDGTMIGDDSKTAAFKAFWESGPSIRGCKLVYSSGRSLDSFLELRKDKRGVLAEPDMLILGVGTEIYTRDQGSDRFTKDLGWSEELNCGWDLQVVREAAYAALADVGKEAMHFRPPQEQNDHKVTCGVRTEALDQVVGVIKAKIVDAQVDVNIISSGQGDWRYLDLVSRQAGKRESLEYVARRCGFPLEHTVACGDSGNDILMLAGDSRAIVVGNAQGDLRRWVADNPQDVQEGPDGLSRLRVTQAAEAEGILEGLEYFGFRG